MLGVPVIIAGNIRGWAWVNDPWFRGVHLAAIMVVMLESWAGMPCPLTVLEACLRERTEQVVAEEAFAVYWMRQLIFYDGPQWMFAVAYTVFGALTGIVGWFFRSAGAAGKADGLSRGAGQVQDSGSLGGQKFTQRLFRVGGATQPDHGPEPVHHAHDGQIVVSFQQKAVEGDAGARDFRIKRQAPRFRRHRTFPAGPRFRALHDRFR